MSVAFEVSTSIDRPVDVVWTRLIDFERAGDWIDSVDEIAIDGPCRLGASIESHNRGKVRSSEIVEFDPDAHVVTLRTRQGPVMADYRYRCAAEGPTRTKVDLVASCWASGPAGLAAPVLRRLMARADRDQLIDLAACIEAEHPEEG